MVSIDACVHGCTDGYQNVWAVCIVRRKAVEWKKDL